MRGRAGGIGIGIGIVNMRLIRLQAGVLFLFFLFFYLPSSHNVLFFPRVYFSFFFYFYLVWKLFTWEGRIGWGTKKGATLHSRNT
ncbi:hypothetical protein P167DRAFT_212479 [Morchella conica CCBAS932]|uniref:Uncharacterized protein n=1 Tax=Morchella conica CCBAS932 TaxID=1392247 RepID=A0A3N4KM82_9PEZI|nr:hypothetical protein P167DRAFT_212479 [Morchella conica CCBAS932]